MNLFLFPILLLTGFFGFDENISAEYEMPLYISEVAVGIKNADNEFIEIYNHGDVPLVLSDSNFRLKIVTSAGTVKKTIAWKQNEIPAKGFFLFKSGDLSLLPSYDASFSKNSMSGTGGVILTDNHDAILDQAAWTDLKTNQSWERNLETSLFSTKEIPDPQNTTWLPPIKEPRPEPEPIPAPMPDPKPEPITYSDKIFINELFPAPDKTNPTKEFVEFYNPSAQDETLGTWKLKDDNLQKKLDASCILPEDLVIKAEGYAIFYLSACKSNPISLNNSGDSLTLYNPSDPLPVSQVEYKNAKNNLSLSFDGASWRWSKFLTPEKVNVFNNLPLISTKKQNEIYVNTYADFSASGNDLDNDALKYTWDFGDGHKSYLATTRHKYEAIGKYIATLKVTDGSEDIITTYNIEVIKFPKLNIKIITVAANPIGVDTGQEYISLKNETKNKINLLNWSIATGWEKMINHPIREKFEIKPGKTRSLTSEYASITLNNTKSKIELRNPAGEVVDEIKYKNKDGVPDGAVYEKTKKKWRWNLSVKKSTPEKTTSTDAVAKPIQETKNITPETIASAPIVITPNDTAIQANLGKYSENPAWRKNQENKIILTSYHSRLAVPQSPARVLGAATVHEDVFEIQNQYLFTPYSPTKHWTVKFWEYFLTTTNSLLNNLLLKF